MSARRLMRAWTSVYGNHRFDAFVRFGAVAASPGFVCMDVGQDLSLGIMSDGEVALNAKGLRRLAAMALREAERLERKAGTR